MNIRYENFPPVFRTILERRGIIGKIAIEDFLHPHLNNLPSPFLLKGMQAAVETITSFIETRRRIVIWGDYDVDGTAGTALLVTFFRSLGKTVSWHVPDRESEGYGLNVPALRKIGEENKDFNYLLITVDCGISNHSEIDEVQKWGTEVIVTDHHAIPEKLPSCTVINPRQVDCRFHEYPLAGAGVAFYLAAGLRSHLREKGYFRKLHEPNLKELLGYVALGTVADMVPLKGINRVLVSAGLEVLENTKLSGLKALLHETGISEGRIFSDDIAYQIGPTINAAGRMAKADLAVRLLVCQDKKEASSLARNLRIINTQRKDICKYNLENALAQIDAGKVRKEQCCIVLGDFHQGILGILAAKLVEIYGYPAIVLAHASAATSEKPIIRGSCRSPEGYDIMKVLSTCQGKLLKYGGHSCAAGLSLKSEDVEGFSQSFCESLKSFRFEKLPGIGTVTCHFPIQNALAQVNVNNLQLLEPFGKGNERPIFRDSSATIIEYRQIGKNREHLLVTFRSDNGGCRGIGFSLGERTSILEEGRTCEVVYTINPNRFDGKLNWQIQILGMTKSSFQTVK